MDTRGTSAQAAFPQVNPHFQALVSPPTAEPGTLEHELLSRRRFATKAEARRAVAAFIDAYNTRRRHSSAEMLPPVRYEQVLAARAAECEVQTKAA